MNTYETILTNFGDQLLNWISDKTGKMHDPFETIYGEGYGPGNAAHILSGLFHITGKERYSKGALIAMDRVFEKMLSPSDNSKFTDIFLYFFGMKAYALISKWCPIQEKKKFEMRFREITYDFEPHNTNGYCLLLSTAIIHSMLGFSVFDSHKANTILSIIENQQNRKGFIEDNFKEDMKPIAYHLFSCAVLAETLRWYKRYRIQELSFQIERIKKIVIRGLSWADHFIASDGSFSMTERSRDQFWTAGAFIYLMALRGMPETESVVINHFSWWKRFVKEDGTVSITPNYFPNSLRVGFEYYSTSTMYATLGFSYLYDALMIWQNKDFVSNLPYPEMENKKIFIDKKAGYLHFRNNNSSLGISLRRHEGGIQGGYCPAMGIFNLVLDSTEQFRPIPSPCYRFRGTTIFTPNFLSEMVNNGVYDGIRAFRRDSNWGTDFPDNASVSIKDNEIVLKKRYNRIKIIKAIRLENNALKVIYIFQIYENLDKLFIMVPILLFDGKNEVGLTIRGNNVLLNYNELTYRLFCNDHLIWMHDQERYMLSGYGITSQIYFKVGENMKRGQRAYGEFGIERIG